MYHHTDVWEAQPIRQPLRRLLLAEKEEVGKMLENMQRRVIEVIKPLVISHLPRLEDKPRPLSFVDYRKLNDIIREDCFPLPRIDET
jgi:hypothetical protein